MSLLVAPASRTGLTCTIVSDPTEAERLQPAWRALLECSGGNEPMLGPTWLWTWWKVFGPLEERRLQIAVIRDGERLVGLAPLLWRRHRYRRVIPFRRLEPLGSGEPEADAVCSDYLNVIAERGAEEAVADTLATALATGEFECWDEFVMPMMDGEGPMPGLVADALRRHGLAASCTVTGAAPYIPLPPTWDAYLKELTPSRRYYLTRSLRAFDKWAGGTAEVRVVSSPGGLEEGKRVLIRLHHERWEGVRGAGVFRSPRFLAFHDAVLPRLLDEGALEMMWLDVRGQPVAALYNLVWNDKVSFYQCGRTRQAPNNVRPGIVILARAIRRAIEAGRREFDFLGGVSFYKTQLALASRPLVQVRAVRPSFRERARVLVERAIAGTRRFRRAVRSR